jgi:MFS family permease
MAALVVAPRRQLTLLCVVSAGWAFSFGLGAPLASLWLAGHGCEPSILGLNTAAYYAGIALVAAALPRLMVHSTRGCVVFGLFLSALTTALFPAIDNLYWWFLLRAAGGAGTALCLIPLETLVNHDAPARHRARNFGFYASAVALGIGLGTVVGLPLYAYAPGLAFGLGGLLPLLAALPAWRRLAAGGFAEEPTANDGTLSLRGNFLGFGTAWAQGFLEGGMVTFLSVYLVGLGHGESMAGALMGVLFLGVIAFQVPVALLADRGGRTRVLLACHLLVLVGVVLVPLFRSLVPVGLLLFLVGGSCAALYPLGLALLGERLPTAALGRANALYLASNCAGSLSGPVVMGLAMSAGGPSALFATAAGSVALILVGWALARQPFPRAVPTVCAARCLASRRAA